MSQTGIDSNESPATEPAKVKRSKTTAQPKPIEPEVNQEVKPQEILPQAIEEKLPEIAAALDETAPSKEARLKVMAIIAGAYLTNDLRHQHIQGNEVCYKDIIDESTILTNLIIEAVYGPAVEQE